MKYSDIIIAKNVISAVDNAPSNTGVIMPQISYKNRSQSRHCIAFDWIQFSVSKTEQFQKGNGTFLFDLRTIEGKSEYYEIWTMHGGEWEKCARLASLAGVNQDGIYSATLENKYCYQDNISGFIEKMLSELGLKFKNFTRVDIAADFQQTDYKTCTPQDFMEKIAKRKYVMKGKKFKVRNGEIEDSLCEDTDIDYSRKRVETIRFGKRKSGMSITMYNKSLHMRKIQDKPYIRELWDIAEFNPDIETYRLEFSSKRNVDILHELDEDGEVLASWDFHDITLIDYPEKYFSAVYARHFIIAVNKEGVRFSRLKPVRLFNFSLPNIVPARLSDKASSNNYLKNKIKTTIQDITNLENSNEVLAENLHTYIQYNVVKHDLKQWFDKKFPYFKVVANRHEKHNDYMLAKQLKYLTQNTLFDASKYNRISTQTGLHVAIQRINQYRF